MIYCPYCGTITYETEDYCIKCGQQLPSDLQERIKPTKKFNRYWYLPLAVILGFLLAYPPYYFFLHSKETTAKEYYERGENALLEEKYEDAQTAFTTALTYKKNFQEAKIAKSFTQKVIAIGERLEMAKTEQESGNFQEALSIINKAESTLKDFHGSATLPLITQIVNHRDLIKIDQLKHQLNDGPNIDMLKILLWEAEAIKNDEAEKITTDIRNQIIDYTFSKASDLLNNFQFNDAQMLVDDGLKYASNSEKLLSLKTTIEKEKTAFETAQQQRIEQAINIATEEQEKNESDAVILEHVNIKQDNKGNWVVQGKVSSVATVPISSVLIKYTLLTKDGNEILSNKVFSFPDKLYTNETGKFEFTHYDIHKEYKDVQIKVNKITWYTN